jgi:RNA polymerase sigma factor (sigma-70 family)
MRTDNRLLLMEKVDKASKELWDAFVKGDNKAFENLYSLNINRLLAYSKKLTKDNEIISDSIQEIFIDLFEKQKKPHIRIENPVNYIFVALRNSIIKKKKLFLNQMTHNFSALEIEEFNIVYSFQDEIIASENQKRILHKLRDSIEKLTPGQKEVIYLRYEEGLKYDDIAKIMRINVESARKQFHRAINSLRQTIENQLIILFLHFIQKKI